jgi:YHS domain-containing protein
MSSNNAIPLPVIGSKVRTACGSEEKFAFDTPRAIYEGKMIFFCTPECQQEFIQDPKNSCTADLFNNETE